MTAMAGMTTIPAIHAAVTITDITHISNINTMNDIATMPTITVITIDDDMVGITRIPNTTHFAIRGIVCILTDNDYCMKMVWHGDIFPHFQLHVGTHCKGFYPFRFYNSTNFRQFHSAVDDISEKPFSVRSADCHEIPCTPGIIPTWQPGGWNTVFVTEFIHFLMIQHKRRYYTNTFNVAIFYSKA